MKENLFQRRVEKRYHTEVTPGSSPEITRDSNRLRA